ncbi:Arc family DNA-binding protein [Delftia deserti]|uniref:Arc family DNA-binding protein n=1 Tax=Delftia deserti TaxID=1651218 RepID=A0ABW5EZB9_9BURK
MARKDEQTNVRLPADLKDWLKAQATAARRSVTAELILRLEQSRKAQDAAEAQLA